MKLKLSENMKRVLCGISQFPDDNNKMLAKRLSVNTSTISTARQRLKNRDLTQKSYLPSFFNLDMGEVVVTTGKYRYQFPDDIRDSLIGFITHPALPFLIVTDKTSWMAMGLIPPEISESRRYMQSKFNDKYIFDMTFDINKARFEAVNTSVIRYFDYSNLLCKTFNVNPSPKQDISHISWDIDELKRNEKIIINSLINDSAPSDFQRSQLVGISHPTITKIRKSLITRGILKTVIKPNLSTFGFSILAWYNIKLEGKEVDGNLLRSLCHYPNNIFSIYNEDNIFIMSVFYDMGDLVRGQQKVDEFMSSTMLSYEDIVFNYFSLENPNFVLKTQLIPTTEIFSEAYKEEEKIPVAIDQEDELIKLLSQFFSEDESLKLTETIKSSMGLNGGKRNPPEDVMSIILELLTEPKHLLPIEETERMALQGKLIEKLNTLRGVIETGEALSSDLKRKRVLIVEDSKAMVDLLKDIFKGANLNVVGAVDNGQSAFDNYKRLSEHKKRPDVVLLDIFLKGKNGIDAARMIKDYDPKASIIVLTSSLDSRIKNQMMVLGVDEYLIKPVTKSQLLDSIKKSISSRRG
jgi:two-component system chemotaxis response regulator CheY